MSCIGLSTCPTTAKYLPLPQLSYSVGGAVHLHYNQSTRSRFPCLLTWQLLVANVGFKGIRSPQYTCSQTCCLTKPAAFTRLLLLLLLQLQLLHKEPFTGGIPGDLSVYGLLVHLHGDEWARTACYPHLRRLYNHLPLLFAWRCVAGFHAGISPSAGDLMQRKLPLTRNDILQSAPHKVAVWADQLELDHVSIHNPNFATCMTCMHVRERTPCWLPAL